MEVLTEMDEYFNAMQKINMDEPVMPYVKGRLVESGTYNKLKKIMETPELEKAHPYCYDLDPEQLEECDIAKINNLYQLGVDRGFIEDDFQYQDEEPCADGACGDEPPVDTESQPVNPRAKIPCFVVMYSAMKDGQIKTGEAYSRAISVQSAKADVVAQLSRFGYSNISILAIEATEEDACNCTLNEGNLGKWVGAGLGALGGAGVGSGLASGFGPTGELLGGAGGALGGGYLGYKIGDAAGENVDVDADVKFGKKARSRTNEDEEGDDQGQADAGKKEEAAPADDSSKEETAQTDDGSSEEEPAPPPPEPKKKAKKAKKEAPPADDAGEDSQESPEDNSDEEEPAPEEDGGSSEENDLFGLGGSIDDTQAADDSGESGSEEGDAQPSVDDASSADDAGSEEDGGAAEDSGQESAETPAEEPAEEPAEDAGSEEDAAADDSSDEGGEDELDANKKAELKDNYKKMFKNTMLKCKFEDRSFDDLSLKEKVKFFTELSKAWKEGYEPPAFMSDKEVDQLEKTVVKKQ